MSRRKSRIILGAVVAVIAVLLLGRLFIVDFYRIPQNGMYPGLPVGSRVFGFKLAYSSPSDVRRGDIVIFRREVKGESYTYIWRVVALPGETIEAAGESLSINGQPVKRDHVRDDPEGVIFREENNGANYEICFKQRERDDVPDASLTVPADHFFVMGDNRFGAADSRYFGPIPFSSIVGRKL